MRPGVASDVFHINVGVLESHWKIKCQIFSAAITGEIFLLSHTTSQDIIPRLLQSTGIFATEISFSTTFDLSIQRLEIA